MRVSQRAVVLSLLTDARIWGLLGQYATLHTTSVCPVMGQEVPRARFHTRIVLSHEDVAYKKFGKSVQPSAR